MKYWRFIPMLLVLAALGGCATGIQPNDPYAIRVDQLTQKVNRLSRVVDNQSKIRMSQRLDRLAEQVRVLRGQVQELAHAVDMSNRRQRDLYQDLYRRLQTLQQGGQHTGTPAPMTQGNNVRLAYDHAFSLLQQGEYKQAQAAFIAFVEKHPESDVADNAAYWLGEARYVVADFEGAVDAFQTVVNDYPDSSKVAGALLKMGYSYYELSQWEEAKQTLNAVTSQYPKSTEARLARDRLSEIQKAGH